MNNNDEKLKWKLLESESVIKDEWIHMKKCKYEFPDGTTFEPYYRYSRKSYVVIVARDTDGNYLCVKQFRQGLNEVTTEFPAGGIDYTGPFDNDEGKAPEDPFVAAKRELMEETGYSSDNWKFLLKIPSHATMADNYAYLYFADKCYHNGSQDLDDTEFLNVEKIKRDELDALINEGKFQQAMHILALLLSDK